MIEMLTKVLQRHIPIIKNQDHPKIDSIQKDLQWYEMYVPLLDETIVKDEINLAELKKLCGLDGIPTDVIRIIATKNKKMLS